MRKALAVILIGAVLFGLAGCKSPDDGVISLSSGGEQTDFPGMEIRVAQVYAEDDQTKLEVIWSNDTAYEVMYGEAYTIERLDADQWVNCAKNALTPFITVGYGLPAGKKIAKTYTITELFDLSQPGEYRFKSNCTVYADESASQNCALWASFVIENGNEEEDHTHATLAVQTANEPVYTYCGNAQSTLYIDGEAYTFGFGHSVTLTDILRNLDYNPYEVCRCMPQYRADTEFGTNYHIHLEYGFVRCDKGQAALTQAQIDAIREIVNWAKTTNCQYQEGDSQ